MKRILLIILTAVLISSCTGNKMSVSDFFAMDTYMNVKISGSDEECRAVQELIYEKDNILKKDRLDMENPEVMELAELSCRISEFTDGAFDITISPLCDIWGFWNHEFRVPSRKEITEALGNTGYENIISDTGEIIIPENFSVDFGGIGKGYTGDCVKELLDKRNVTSAIITLGGNVHAIGSKADGTPWTVGIKDPSGEKEYYGTVNVENKAVVTSGGYERYFEDGGKTYQHIIDPETGYPAETDVASVTVISEKGAVADALSTAFFVMGEKKTENLCKKSGCRFENTEFSVIIILKDGTFREFGDIKLNG